MVPGRLMLHRILSTAPCDFEEFSTLKRGTFFPVISAEKGYFLPKSPAEKGYIYK